MSLEALPCWASQASKPPRCLQESRGGCAVLVGGTTVLVLASVDVIATLPERPPLPNTRHPSPLALTSLGMIFYEPSCVGFADRFPPYRTHLQYLHQTGWPIVLAHRQDADRKSKTGEVNRPREGLGILTPTRVPCIGLRQNSGHLEGHTVGERWDIDVWHSFKIPRWGVTCNSHKLAF
ncbi:hypothetical protein F5Y09DRAFT_303852 [Xylaria sp. FL1042]|nr:hypothetical protein F5Y09DRAFT_303852 [Xylaria sp. FL1042]